MALAATTVWEIRSTAAASNVNGGGFNASNAEVTKVDYSLQDAAQVTITDLSGEGGTTLTSAAGAGGEFTTAMCGNLINIAGQGTYEVVTRTSATVVEVDRNLGTFSGATGRVGGALNNVTDAMMEQLVPGNVVWIASGTYTTGAVSVSTPSPTATLPISLVGYKATRGDVCAGTDRPTLNSAALGFIVANSFWRCRNIIFAHASTDTTTCLKFSGGSCAFYNCKFSNTQAGGSTVNAITCGGSNYNFMGCEFAASGSATHNGTTPGDNSRFVGCYFHDLTGGVVVTATYVYVVGCVFASCASRGLYVGSSSLAHAGLVAENTFYNCAIGIEDATTSTGAFTGFLVCNNVFSECGTDISLRQSVPGHLILAGNCHSGSTTANFSASALALPMLLALEYCSDIATTWHPADNSWDPLLVDPANGDFRVRAAARGKALPSATPGGAAASTNWAVPGALQPAAVTAHVG